MFGVAFYQDGVFMMNVPLKDIRNAFQQATGLLYVMRNDYLGIRVVSVVQASMLMYFSHQRKGEMERRMWRL